MPPRRRRIPAPQPAPRSSSPSAVQNRRVLGDPTPYRVVFAGPMGVGKTTAVRNLSGISTSETEVPLTAIGLDEDLPDGKDTTTVGIDYGVWRPTPEIAVALIGTPGQDRFAEVRTSYMMPGTRVLIWLFGDRDDLPDQAERWIRSVGTTNVGRIVLAITRTDDDAVSARVHLAPLLARLGAGAIPIYAADGRDQRSVEYVVSKALDLPEDIQEGSV